MVVGQQCTLQTTEVNCLGRSGSPLTCYSGQDFGRESMEEIQPLGGDRGNNFLPRPSVAL